MSDIFEQSLFSLSETLNSVEPDERWTLQSQILKDYKRCCDGFREGCDTWQDELTYILDQHKTVEQNTMLTAEVIQKWEACDNTISLPVIAAIAMRYFGFTEADRTQIDYVLMACILGEVQNPLPYHNNLHYRKVLLHVARMIAVHNFIYADAQSYLGKNKIAALLCAACVHDLGHNGTGNIRDRTYYMAEVEGRSYAYAQPFLSAAGCEAHTLDDIYVMLLTTDVSPIGDPISPSNQLRAVYEYHFGDSENSEPLDLTKNLKVLEERSDLCLMCMLLHEADIMNSAAMTYDFMLSETRAINQEVGNNKASPEQTLLFLEKICGGTMTSDAGYHLGQNNFIKIMHHVMDDYKNGNKSYV